MLNNSLLKLRWNFSPKSVMLWDCRLAEFNADFIDLQLNVHMDKLLLWGSILGPKISFHKNPHWPRFTRHESINGRFHVFCIHSYWYVKRWAQTFVSRLQFNTCDINNSYVFGRRSDWIERGGWTFRTGMTLASFQRGGTNPSQILICACTDSAERFSIGQLADSVVVMSVTKWSGW